MTLLKVRILQQQHPFLLILILFEIIQESMKINNLKFNVFSLQRYLTKNILTEFENWFKNEDNRKRYYYDDIEAVFNNDYLTAFVTYHLKYKPAKGVHVGSTYDEVVSKYGSATHIMQLDDLILYEYEYKTIRGEDSLLRFAINKNDNRVNHISARVLVPSDNTNNDNDIPENVQQAAGAFLSCHENITNRNFRRAYNLQTYSRQQNMGDIDTFARGYSSALKSEITELNLISNDGDHVTLS